MSPGIEHLSALLGTAPNRERDAKVSVMYRIQKPTILFDGSASRRLELSGGGSSCRVCLHPITPSLLEGFGASQMLMMMLPQVYEVQPRREAYHLTCYQLNIHENAPRSIEIDKRATRIVTVVDPPI